MLLHTRPAHSPDEDMALRLLQVIQGLSGELDLRAEDVSLDASLERDLGLDSLARVELVARVEQHFGVTLDESVFNQVQTPRDLLRAVMGARGERRAVSPAAISQVSLGEAEAAPRSAETLVEVLSWHVKSHPDRLHLRLYSDHDDGEAISYSALWDGAAGVAAGLQALAVSPGRAVALMLPTGRDYLYAFFGVLLAGAIPVPVYPPARPNQIEDHLKRHAGILNNCQALVLITVDEARRPAHWLKSQVDALRHVTTVDGLHQAGDRYLAPALGPEDIAFLQYTSGSTGQPKGVVLTHGNLLANIRAMGQWVRAGPEDVFVSWLPLYHDMGLIGAWLGSLYYAAHLVLMPPLSFLARPRRWFEAMHRYRGTLTAAPNFGYELCLRRIDEGAMEGLDLASCRASFNGAEAVSPKTVARFCQRFAAAGFRREAMMPVYGLAENSVGLAFPPLGRGPVTDCVEREAFSRSGRALAVAEDATALCFVACGQPLEGHQIRVVDDSGRELPERQEGQVQFRGPSATSGYYRNPGQTRALFQAGWLNTGDLGYFADGDLFVTGRIKDVIVHGGRNVYPQELEEAVGEIDGVRKGRVAVFGSADPDAGTERLVVLAETRETGREAKQALKARVNDAALALTGAPFDDVVLAPPGTVLKTSSGKIRRTASREVYEQGKTGAAPKGVWRQMLHLQLMRLGPWARRWRKRSVAGLYAAYAWSCYGLLAPVTWLGVFLLPRLRGRWRVVHHAARLLAWLTATPIRVQGREHLNQGGPFVLVANHASYLDAYALVAVLPEPVSFVAKAELAAKRSTGPPLRRIGASFVERFDQAKGIADARNLGHAARAGRSLLFFPEGTFTRVPGLQPFHMGAFTAAAETGLAVIPIAIRGSRSMLRSGSWFPRPGRIRVTVGAPIEPAAVADAQGDTWRTALNLRQQARGFILRHCGEPDLAVRRQRPDGESRPSYG